MNYRESLEEACSSRKSYDDIVKRFFFIDPTCSFNNKHDIAYEIISKISNKFEVPIINIHVAGSAKLGFSLSKNTDFNPGVSDLDIAIIDSSLFIKYVDLVLAETRNYSRANLFPTYYDANAKKRISLLPSYQQYISKGIFHPKDMPNCDAKLDLINFFSELSLGYRQLFKSISMCIYLSENCFKQKQINGIHVWQSNKGITT